MIAARTRTRNRFRIAVVAISSDVPRRGVKTTFKRSRPGFRANSDILATRGADNRRNPDTSAEAVFTTWRVLKPLAPLSAVLRSLSVSDRESASAVTQAYAKLLSLAVHE